MNIIEPCCAERQLGHLLRENRGHAALFQTNGDMTLQKWMKTTMLMVGDRPRTLTLAVPVFTEKMTKAVAKYLQLGWVERLRLMTTDPLTPEMAQHFAGLVNPDADASGTVAAMDLAADACIPDGLLMFSGPEGTVVVQGPMFDTITPRLCLYAGMFGKTERLAVRSITDAWEARFRARRYEADLTPDPSPARGGEVYTVSDGEGTAEVIGFPTDSDHTDAAPAVSGFPADSDQKDRYNENTADTKKKIRTRKTKKDEKPTDKMA